MSLKLSITSGYFTDEDLQSLSRDLCKTLNRQADFSAKLLEIGNAQGTKGDAVTVGTILLTFISSGAVVALINVLKAFFERRHSLEIELEDADGKKFRIKADSVSSDKEIDKTIKLAQKFFKV